MCAKQPQILVNNRLYEGLENKHGDFGTPEKYVPPTGLPGMDWEVNHTLNESYGYSAHDTHWKDTTTVVQLLCDIVSKGGNLLLNIGPDAQGRVPEPWRGSGVSAGSESAEHAAETGYRDRLDGGVRRREDGGTGSRVVRDPSLYFPTN